MRSVLVLREPNGELVSETLGRGEDFAELVDPTDGSLRHHGPFVMYGVEWRIESVSVTESLIWITCVSTGQSVNNASPLHSQSGQVA